MGTTNKRKRAAGVPKKRESGVRPASNPPDEEGADDRRNKRQRRHSRFVVELPLTYSIDAGPRLESRCVNLSLGGMFIRSDERAPHGAAVRVWLTLPTTEELMLSGVVRWVTDEGMGIQHELLGARDTYVLSEYLASLRE